MTRLPWQIGTAHGLYKGVPKLDFERLQDSDVIMVGEFRDTETMGITIALAGHGGLTTVHMGKILLTAYFICFIWT